MEMKKIFNKNFNKGVSVFQMFLMGTMILGAIVSNHLVIYFSMVACLAGYLEPDTERFSIKLNFPLP